MRLSRPGTLIIHTTSKKVFILRVEKNPQLVNWHPHSSLHPPHQPSSPFIPPTISSSSMKHLFLFLFDMGDSIKASGSKCCNTRLSVEMSKNVTLCCTERKNSLHFSLLFFPLQKYWTNKTCIPGPEMLQRAHVCWDWLWNVEQCWLLSFAFQPEQAHKSTAEIWAELETRESSVWGTASLTATSTCYCNKKKTTTAVSLLIHYSHISYCLNCMLTAVGNKTQWSQKAVSNTRP